MVAVAADGLSFLVGVLARVCQSGGGAVVEDGEEPVADRSSARATTCRYRHYSLDHPLGTTFATSHVLSLCFALATAIAIPSTHTDDYCGPCGCLLASPLVCSTYVP